MLSWMDSVNKAGGPSLRFLLLEQELVAYMKQGVGGKNTQNFNSILDQGPLAAASARRNQAQGKAAAGTDGHEKTARRRFFIGSKCLQGANQAPATLMPLNSPVAIFSFHTAGPVMWALVPPESTATVTGMSTTSNS